MRLVDGIAVIAYCANVHSITNLNTHKIEEISQIAPLLTALIELSNNFRKTSFIEIDNFLISDSSMLITNATQKIFSVIPQNQNVTNAECDKRLTHVDTSGKKPTTTTNFTTSAFITYRKKKRKRKIFLDTRFQFDGNKNS